MGKLALRDGEKKLGTWTINYLPPGGGRYTGRLLVTNQRLIYHMRFDTSRPGSPKTMPFLGRSRRYVSISKDAVRATTIECGLLKRKVIVVLKGGQRHVFACGCVSIDRLAAAIGQR